MDVSLNMISNKPLEDTRCRLAAIVDDERTHQSLLPRMLF